jgi:ribosomal protein S27E
MSAAELVATLALPEQHPGRGNAAQSRHPSSTTNMSMLTDDSAFLNASRTMMASQGSLLDDVDPDVGVTVGVGVIMMNPNSNSNSNHAAAAHDNGDRAALPPPSPVRTTTSGIPIPAYPTNTAITNASLHTATETSNSSSIPNNSSYRAYENDHHDDSGSTYSDDSAVRQAREHMEEMRNLHPVILPKPEEMMPPLPSAARVLAEPSIPVPRSSRRCVSGSQSSQIRRPPDLVQGKVYRMDQNNNGSNRNLNHKEQQQSPKNQQLQSDEMLVRCDSCQTQMQTKKSAIVVQCPTCRAISPAKSTS